jgi:hypothetical protein
MCTDNSCKKIEARRLVK